MLITEDLLPSGECSAEEFFGLPPTMGCAGRRSRLLRAASHAY